MKVPPAPQLPCESDFFISYSTAPETESFRLDPNCPHPEGGDVDTSVYSTALLIPCTLT